MALLATTNQVSTDVNAHTSTEADRMADLLEERTGIVQEAVGDLRAILTGNAAVEQGLTAT